MSTPGLDLDNLGAWLAGAVPGAGSTLTAELIAGGKSNQPYRVADGSSAWIVRRPPLGHVLATAHDMAREFRVMDALQSTSVPVPRTYALCTDDSVVGAPFYVMELVVGTPYRTSAELNALGDPQRVETIATRFIDTLAALHAVDPDSVGLGDFGRTEGFLSRQVERWHQQMLASHSRDLPAADELYQRLAAAVPSESASGIVHGDYRLDNVLFSADDQPAAVIDWEMATVGDPLTDLALLLVYQRLAAAAGDNAIADAASAAGYPDEVSLLTRYQGSSERDLSNFGWYLGLASFKLATIAEGIHFRYVNGKTVGPGFEQMGAAVVPILTSGLHALEGN
jgi:aminoglycoside phosphotransferase (APT) family kinase protein